MTASISRKSGADPAASRMAITAPIDSPGYSDGKSALETVTSAAEPSRHALIATSAIAITAAIRITSIGSSRLLMISENDASVTIAAVMAGHFGTAIPLAVKRPISSSTAANSTANATASNMASGASQTTATAIAINAAPLKTRVIGERAGTAGKAGKGRPHSLQPPL